MNGWIKLHRKVIESPVYQDPFLFRLWTICLMKAAHKPTKQLVDKTEIQLLPGQFITGRFALEEEYNRGLKPKQKVPGTTLWSWLKRLETWGNLNIESNNKFSVVTLTNWDFYQGKEEEPDNNFDSNLSATCQQLVTNKNLRIKEFNNTTTPTHTEAHMKGNPIEVYKQEIGRFTDTIRDNMIDWLDNNYFDEPEAIMIAAIQQAAIYERRSWAYIERILQECLNKKVRTVEQFRQKKAEAAAEKEKKLVRLPKEERDEKREGIPSETKYDYGF